MSKPRNKALITAALLSLIALTAVLAASQSDDEAAAWKKLGKIRIPAGINLSNAGTMSWGFHLKPLREAMEAAGFDREVTIAIILDGGAKVKLGTYKPSEPEPAAPGEEATDKTGVAPVLSWASIPNLREVDVDVRTTPGMLYRLIFLNALGKQKAAILVRVNVI